MCRILNCFWMALVLLTATGDLRAEGWQWPNLNPFTETKATKPASYHYKDDAATKSWLPSWKIKSSTTTQSGMWQKTKTAPTSMMRSTQQTMNAMNPFKAKPKNTANTTVFGSGAKKKAETKSWLSPWGDSTPAKEPPQTMSEWIALPRAE